MMLASVHDCVTETIQDHTNTFASIHGQCKQCIHAIDTALTLAWPVLLVNALLWAAGC